MPAARVFSTIVWRLFGAQSSLVGQPQLLFITCGRIVGFGFGLLRSVGAMKNWKHSVYVSGLPFPWSMLRQPIHFAPGATPIWCSAPSSPTAVPVVCVPWPWSSHGTMEVNPQGFGVGEGGMLAWIESCQL